MGKFNAVVLSSPAKSKTSKREKFKRKFCLGKHCESLNTIEDHQRDSVETETWEEEKTPSKGCIDSRKKSSRRRFFMCLYISNVEKCIQPILLSIKSSKMNCSRGCCCMVGENGKKVWKTCHINLDELWMNFTVLLVYESFQPHCFFLVLEICAKIFLVDYFQSILKRMWFKPSSFY